MNPIFVINTSQVFILSYLYDVYFKVRDELVDNHTSVCKRMFNISVETNVNAHLVSGISKPLQ